MRSRRPGPGPPGESRAVQRLRKQLTKSHQVHTLASDPLMAVVRIDRLLAVTMRWLWIFLGCGLAFTTSGVQAFLAVGLTPADPVWWGCWLVEPALAGILIHLLRWQAEMIGRGVKIASGWVVTLRWFLLGCTLVMNVVPVLGGASRGMLFAHAAIPILVFLLAESMPIIQARCAQARAAILANLDTSVTASAASVVSTRPVELAPVVNVGQAATLTEVQPVPAVPVLGTDTASSASSSVVPAASSVSLDGLRLPSAMQTTVRNLAVQLERDGRRVTAEDLVRTVRLPASLAQPVADRFASVNGHAH